MNATRFEVIVNIINSICYDINSESESNIEYIVLQGLSSKDPYILDPFIIYKITDFYNYNWLGNADFMHIPSFSQVEYNCRNFPLIIAREKDTKNMIGISTLKYEENKGLVLDPYYPISHEKYFSITGILTKKNNPYKGVGKTIYEIALKGHYEFNKVYNDTSIMCVIDCRNKNSVNALNAAAESFNSEIEEDIVAKISGYYTLTNENNEMVEAPTIVLKVEESEKRDENRSVVSFVHDEEKGLFESLLDTIEGELTDVSEPIINMDEEAGIVSYYHVNNYNSLPRIISNGTERGNDREVCKDTNIAALCRVRTFKR